MTKAFLVHEPGGPESLQFEEVRVGDPGPSEVRLRHTAIGLNFIDVYFRTGAYPAPQSPFTPGLEAAGVVEAIGEDVDDLSVGDRVAYASAPIGAYAEARLMPAGASGPVAPARRISSRAVTGLLRHRVLRTGSPTGTSWGPRTRRARARVGRFVGASLRRRRR